MMWILNNGALKLAKSISAYSHLGVNLFIYAMIAVIKCHDEAAFLFILHIE